MEDIESVLREHGFAIAPAERLLPRSAEVKLAGIDYIPISVGFQKRKMFYVIVVGKSEEELEELLDEAVKAVLEMSAMTVEISSKIEGRSALLSITVQEV